ncbi:penicillin-binding protein 2 [Arenimonas sp. GDDSR-1]|uniref:penicillin-binding protein 2 n=1 Tax=Arenimonas sp. GDDSR-1 TaxID=2950125 RepID=UPI002619B133|nr:penicillin-binding protein 2 [Arenimonas sp. GDDSR-1]
MAAKIKNTYFEAELFRQRAFVAMLSVAVVMAALLFGYFNLQVLRFDEYREQADSNRVRLKPTMPARGLIYDRKGRLLTDNISAYRLELTPEQVDDIDATLQQLGKLVVLSKDDLRRFRRAMDSSRKFLPITVKLRLSEDEVAKFSVNRFRFPGVEVVPYLTRRYLYDDLFAHVIGYVARLDEADLKAMGDERYSVLTHTGKTGLERSYEEQLRGTIGYEEVETNARGRSLGVLKRHSSQAGTDLKLSIDVDLQKATVAAFGELTGSAVAVDPATGEVLAMVSLPSFNTNLFVNGISSVDYAALSTDPSQPLFNRNVRGGTPPGSTIKPFVALAGLESGLRKPEDTVYSSGEFFIPGQRRGYRDAHAGGHGTVNLYTSIAESVNTYYYKLAMDMGIVKFDAYMRRYGFGQPTGIDLIGEVAGTLPSPEWKRKRFKQPWYLGETVIAGIGQGYWVVTPLQLAQGTASLANGGRRIPLRLVHETRTGLNQPWQRLPAPKTTSIGATPAQLQAIRTGMEATMQTRRGTGWAIGLGSPYRIAGKTGTVQKISRRGSVSMDPRSLPLHLRHQALFIGYAPAEDPKIAVVVVVEHGGYGASTAGPIARKMMDAYLLPPPAAPPPVVAATENPND